jgi:ABC-type glutathione transport system ATPase component
LFILDEPTTGLHFEDVRILLEALQRLVNAGHSLVVIEHNLEVLKCADWIIDLGPEAGNGGGQLVVAGTPETVAACPESHTGRFLKPLLKISRPPRGNRHQAVRRSAPPWPRPPGAGTPPPPTRPRARKEHV